MFQLKKRRCGERGRVWAQGRRRPQGWGRSSLSRALTTTPSAEPRPDTRLQVQGLRPCYELTWNIASTSLLLSGYQTPGYPDTPGYPPAGQTPSCATPQFPESTPGFQGYNNHTGQYPGTVSRLKAYIDGKEVHDQLTKLALKRPDVKAGVLKQVLLLLCFQNLF